MNNTHKYCATLLLLCTTLTGCNGIMSDIYDDAPRDDTFAEGFTDSGTQGRFTLMLDARDYYTWHYIDLRSLTMTHMPVPMELTGEWNGVSGWTYNEVIGTKVTKLDFKPTDAQTDAETWDFALHHFDVRTNGGSATETPYTTIDEALAHREDLRGSRFTADAWSTKDVITDLTGMMGFRIGYQNSYVNEVLSRMVTMDFSTPPPTYHPSGRVYVMRLSDGTEAAIQLTSYMSKTGTKGFLTFDIVYPF